jgi:pilus assembly protein CpaD
MRVSFNQFSPMSALPRFAILIVLGGGMAGCATKHDSVADVDYRARHPIALTEGPITTDIFVTGRDLDHVSREHVRSFASAYLKEGRGPVAIQYPRGTMNDAHARASVALIQRELAAAGVNGNVNVGAYDVQNNKLASPVRLAFLGIKAQLPQTCGKWPADLMSGSSLEGWSNKPYWNHGCAYQNAFAQQVSDPRDFATARAEAPSDVIMRTRAIEAVRKGSSPATSWDVTATSIGGGGQ